MRLAPVARRLPDFQAVITDYGLECAWRTGRLRLRAQSALSAAEVKAELARLRRFRTGVDCSLASIRGIPAAESQTPVCPNLEKQKCRIEICSNLETIQLKLLKLRVNKGGRGTYQKLAPGWELFMSENTGDKEFPYLVRLQYPRRNAEPGVATSTVRLRKAHVHTRSRSVWARDCVWRLTPEHAEFLAPSIHALMGKSNA